VIALTPNPWKEVSAARIPVVHLVALSPLRNRPNIRINLQKDTAWVRWSADGGDLIRCLLPVPGVEFFTCRSGTWFRFRSLLPTTETPPEGNGISVAAVLVPSSIEPVQPDTIVLTPVQLSVVRCSEPRPTSALVCSIQDLQKWADMATTAEISMVKGARADGIAILLGSHLPSIFRATRYWGDEVFVPIGFRPEPDLPAAALRMVVGTEADELVFLDDEGVRVVPRKAFEPLTRAGIRLALRSA
jgi:hypothetical protein